jgi:hypothetical protein
MFRLSHFSAFGRIRLLILAISISLCYELHQAFSRAIAHAMRTRRIAGKRARFRDGGLSIVGAYTTAADLNWVG